MEGIDGASAAVQPSTQGLPSNTAHATAGIANPSPAVSAGFVVPLARGAKPAKTPRQTLSE
eukprot:10619635-Alexandrium_andersonii.AAC.2